MAAWSRLWFRAALWRGCVVTAVLATGLAFLYPAVQPAPVPAVTSRFTPLAPAQVLGTQVTDILTALGREVPLPPGTWHGLQTMTSKTGVKLASSSVVRVDGTTVTGLVVVQGAHSPPGATRPMDLNYTCDGPHTVLVALLPAPRGVMRECWNVVPRFLPADWEGAGHAAVFTHALARLREGGLEVNGLYLGANWFREDADGVLLVSYYMPMRGGIEVPDAPAAWTREAARDNPHVAAYLEKVKAWTEAFTPLLDGGADNALRRDDVDAVWARPEGQGF
jgi:hypothetical protein